MDSTIDYYNRNAHQYIENTVNLDMSSLYDAFESNVPHGGIILDLGCGSGRDSKHFLESGFQVIPVDGSIEICKSSSKYLGGSSS